MTLPEYGFDDQDSGDTIWTVMLMLDGRSLTIEAKALAEDLVRNVSPARINPCTRKRPIEKKSRAAVEDHDHTHAIPSG
jgi:hypothetical protein